MKIRCLHGYFIFNELNKGEVSNFVSRFGLDIVFSDRTGHYTFSKLANAPDYSIAGGTYLGADCIETISGSPWEIMRENNLVYNFLIDEVVNINTIRNPIRISNSGNYYASNGLILPGSIMENGLSVKDYAAFYYQKLLIFKYSEIDSD